MKASKVFILVSIMLVILIAIAGCGGSQQVQEPKQTQATKENSGSNSPKVDSKPLQATLLTASVGGQWDLLGNGLAGIIAKAYPGSAITVEPSDPIANQIKVQNGEAELGFAMSSEVVMGLNGQGPFEGKKMDKLTALGNFTTTQFIAVITKEFSDKYGIKTYEDLAAKKPPVRASIAARGNITSFYFEDIFKQSGFTDEDIKSWGGEVVYQPLKTGLDAIKNRKVDLAGGPIPHPYSGIIDVHGYVPLVALYMSDGLVKHEIERWSDSPQVISKDAYKFLDKDMNTFGPATIMMVNPKVNEELVYKFTKAVVERWDDVQNIHASLKASKLKDLPKVAPLKLHPGAERYYREAGLL